MSKKNDTSILDAARKVAERDGKYSYNVYKKSSTPTTTPITSEFIGTTPKKSSPKAEFKPVGDTKLTPLPKSKEKHDDYLDKLVHDIGYTGEKILSGTVGALDDAGSYLGAALFEAARLPVKAISKLIPNMSGIYNKVDKGLHDYSKELIDYNVGDEWDKSIEERYNVPDLYKKYVGNTATNFGAMTLPILAEIFSGGASPWLDAELAKQGISLSTLAPKFMKPKASDAMLFLSAAGSNTKEGHRQTDDLGKSFLYGTLGGLGEVATEKLFGGIGGTGIGDELIDLSKVKFLNKIAKNPIGNFMLDNAGEIAEEEIMAFADPIFQRMTINPDAEFPDAQVLGETALQTILLTSAMKAATYPIQKHQKIKAIDVVNATTDAINTVLVDEADKFEPLPTNATEDEIKARQNQIKGFHDLYAAILDSETDVANNSPVEADSIEEVAKYVVERRNNAQTEQKITESQPYNTMDKTKSTQTKETEPNLNNAKISNTIPMQTETELKTAEIKANEAAYEAGKANVPMNKVTLTTPEQIDAYNRGRMEAIEDIPTEATGKPDQIFINDRTYEYVGDRKVKAFQYENPEVKPYYREIAQELKNDIASTIKGERMPIKDADGYIVGYTGTKRLTSEAISRIKDTFNVTYGQIEDALDRIIKDAGQENVALAKKIELVIDDMLTYGYTTIDGYEIKPNAEYIEVKNRIGSIEAENNAISDDLTNNDVLPLDFDDLPIENTETQVAQQGKNDETTETVTKSPKNGTKISESVTTSSENDTDNKSKTKTTFVKEELDVDVVKEITENSIDINSVHAERILSKDKSNLLKGLRKLGQGLDVKIRLFNGKSLGVDGIDGFYDKATRTMYIDYFKPQKPIQSVVRHEVVHVFSNDNPTGYQTFANFVVERYIDKYGEEELNTWIDNKIGEYADNGFELDYDGAIEELCADYGMDMLQSESDVKKFIAQNRSVAEKLKDIIRRIMNVVRRAFNLPQNISTSDAMIQLGKLDSTVSTLDGRVERSHEPYRNSNLPGALSVADLNKAQELLMKGILEIERSGAKKTQGAGNKFSIIMLDNGITYVNASRKVITGNDKAVWRKQITNFFNELLSNEKSIDITTLEGDILTITKKETANKARDNYKDVRGKKVQLSDEEFRVKLTAVAHIDEIVKTSRKYSEKKSKDTKSHHFAKDGFSYRTAYFQDFDGEYYKLDLSIGHNGEIATVYNVGKIKKDTIPSATKGVAAVGSKPHGMMSINKISQNGENVKQNSNSNDVLKNSSDSGIVDYGRDNNFEQIWLPKGEYARVSSAIMAKNAGKTKAELNVFDYIYGSNYFYLYRNFDIGSFSVFEKLDIESESEVINRLREMIDDGLHSYTDRKRLGGLLDDVRSGKRRNTGNNGWVENGRTTMGDDRVLGTQQRSDSVGHSKAVSYNSEENKDNGVKFSINSKIPKGENPARDIDVPAIDSKGRKVSRHARTILEASATPDSYVSPIMEDVINGKYSHDVITDKMAQENAFKKISRDESVLDKNGNDTGKTERVLDGEKYKKVLNDTLNRFEDSDLNGKDDVALLHALYTNAANSYDYMNQVDENGVPLAEKLIVAMVQTASKAGQTLQASRLLKKTTPAGKLYDLEMFVKNMNKEIKAQWGEWVDNENARINEQWGEYKDGKRNYKNDKESKKRRKDSRRRGMAYSKYQKDIVLNENLVKQLLEATNQEQALAIEEKLMEDIASQILATFTDKTRALRYTAMLFNPRTHVRNIVGNTMFGCLVEIRDVIDATLQMALIKDKMKRTKTIALSSEQRAEYNKLIDYADELFNEQMQNIKGEGKYDMLNSKIDEHRKIFGFTTLEWLRRKGSGALEIEDIVAIRYHFKRHFAKALLAKGITLNDIQSEKVSRKIIEETMKYATEQAQKATFRDANNLAKAIDNLAKTNALTDVAIAGVIPFKKTPMNILRRGIEYSPASVIKAGYKAIKQNIDVKQGHLDSVDVTGILEDLSEGLTGTMLFAIGAWAVRAGILAIRPGDEKDEEKLGEAEGHQSYALELSLGKLGDYSFTIDWAAPAVMPLFMGAECQKTLEDGFDINVLELLAKISNPVIETSMLSGVLGVIDAVRYSESDSDVLVDLTTEVMSSYLLQYFPSLFGAVARTIDEVESRTSRPSKAGDEGFLEMLGRKIANKVPILRTVVDSKPYVDIMGKHKTKEDAGDYIMSALQNFILPGYINKMTSSNAVNELSNIVIETERTDFIPKYVTKIGTHKLTHDEYYYYHEERGKLYDEVIPYLTEQDWYKKCSADEKAEILADFKDAADRLTKKSFRSDFNLSNKKLESIYANGSRGEDIVDTYLLAKYIDVIADVNGDNEVERTDYVNTIINTDIDNNDAWQIYLSKYPSKIAEKAKNCGIDAELFMTAVIDMDGIKADYNDNGKVISGSRRTKIEKYLNSVCNSYKEYLFLLGMEYSSVKKSSDYIKYFGKDD